jgi:pimeloyl-ACP methyl ester carboxylesterase
MPAHKVAHQTTFVTVAGKKTQLTTGGSGPPLVYLHSAGGETEWTAFHDLLAANFKVHIPAHPGFALSEGLDQIDTIGDMAWHYVDLFAQLGLTRAPVVGFSLGGWLAVELAILRPQLVGKLVLVNPAGLHVDKAPMAELFIDDLAKLRELLFFDPKSPVVNEVVPTSTDDPRILNFLRAREATARVAWNPYLHNPKLPQHLHRVECPALVLCGRHDKLIPFAHGEEYARLLPKARLQIFEKCGHELPFEHPEEFAAQVIEFVSTT